MSGLSTASFMTGAMKGYQFSENIEDQQQDREDRGKLNDQKIERNKRDLMIEDFSEDARAIAMTGEIPKGFSEKYKDLGITKAMNPEWRERRKNAAALLLRSEELDSSEDALAAANLYLQDSFNKRTKNDGEKRMATGIRQMPDGRIAIELEVEGKDGKKRKAPLTKNGTADDDDEVVLLDQGKIAEWQKAVLGQAEISHQIDKVKDDPKELGNLLHYIGTGEYLFQPQKANLNIETLYDPGTGTERKAAVSDQGQFSHWLGGAKAPNSKGSRGASGGGMSEDQFGELFAQLNEDLQEIETSSTFTMPEERETAKQNVIERYRQLGIDYDLIDEARIALAEKGQNRNPTQEELLSFMYGQHLANQRNGTLEDNIGKMAGLIDMPSGSNTPPPRDMDPIERIDSKLSEIDNALKNQNDFLEQSANSMRDPQAVERAQVEIAQLEEQKETLMLTKEAQMALSAKGVNPSVKNQISSYTKLISQGGEKAGQAKVALAKLIAEAKANQGGLNSVAGPNL